MYRRWFVVLFAVAVAAPFIALSHDASKHKGKPTAGEVVSLAGDRLELKTAAKTITVIVDDKTKFERGDHPAAKADLKEGIKVTVFGTTLASGELVAREILIGAPAPAKSRGAKAAGRRD